MVTTAQEEILTPEAGPGGGRGVLLITAHFPPNRRPGTHRLLRFARDLDAMDWRVSVLTIAPTSYRPNVPVDERLLAEIPARAHVVRTDVPGRAPRATPTAGSARRRGSSSPGRPPSRFRRFWRLLWSTPDNEIGWWWSAVPGAMRLVKEGRVQVIVSSGPPFTCHLIAAEVARRTGLPWVADFRDPWSRAPWGLEVRDQGWTGWVHRRLERMTIRRANSVVLNTGAMQDDFAAHYDAATAAKFLTISNGFDSAVLDRAVRPIARSAPPDTLILCHTGSLYQARDPRPLLRALARLRADSDLPRDAFRLQLVGGVGAEFDTRAEVERLGLADVVEFRPPVAHGESLGYLRAADILLVIQPDTQVQVPVKLYEYLWARKPILALASDGAVSDLVREAGAGQVVPASDEGAIIDALRTFYAGRSSLSTDYTVPASYLLRFEGRELSRRLHDVLHELTT